MKVREFGFQITYNQTIPKYLFSKFNTFKKIENIETEESFHRILATDIIAEKIYLVSKEPQWMDLQSLLKIVMVHQNWSSSIKNYRQYHCRRNSRYRYRKWSSSKNIYRSNGTK